MSDILMFRHNTICTTLLVGELLDSLLTELTVKSLISVLTCYKISLCIRPVYLDEYSWITSTYVGIF
jgi:hypothetical protein